MLKFKRRSALNEEMSLQITSMADIFTILLVFLLKSYTTGTTALSPSSDLRLPTAQSSDFPSEALKIEISKHAVRLEGNPIIALNQYHVDSQLILSNGTLPALNESFDRERKRQLIIAQSNTDVKLDPKLIILADQQVPFITLKTVLASAALHGYTDFKLAVIQKEK